MSMCINCRLLPSRQTEKFEKGFRQYYYFHGWIRISRRHISTWRACDDSVAWAWPGPFGNMACALSIIMQRSRVAAWRADRQCDGVRRDFCVLTGRAGRAAINHAQSACITRGYGTATGCPSKSGKTLTSREGFSELDETSGQAFLKAARQSRLRGSGQPREHWEMEHGD